MRMTAHTTPRMIIIYKKKVMRKKRKSGFHMKNINSKVFFCFYFVALSARFYFLQRLTVFSVTKPSSKSL